MLLIIFFLKLASDQLMHLYAGYLEPENALETSAKRAGLRVRSVLELGGMGRDGTVPRTRSCVRLERKDGTE